MDPDRRYEIIEHIEWHAFMAEALALHPEGKNVEDIAWELNAGAEIGGEG